MPEILFAGITVATPLLIAAGKFLLHLLPLVSDRVNARKVRLLKAANKQSK